MTVRRALLLLVAFYGLIIVPYTSYLKDRPVEVKLGYLPEGEILKLTTGGFRNLTADLIMMRLLFYYGTLLDPYRPKNLQRQINFPAMFRRIETVLRLDPYNTDAYYFAQGAFTWEVGHAADVNKLLDYGMRYRPRDYWLPFYAGFNEAFFLKNYAKGGEYMRRAAEISGNPLFIGLAGRFFYESGETALAINFLDTMIQTTRDAKLKRIYEVRREAFRAVDQIEKAVRSYAAEHRHFPEGLDQLVRDGYLPALPKDPYGGTFYLDLDGKVRSTSKFAVAPEKGRLSPGGTLE